MMQANVVGTGPHPNVPLTLRLLAWLLHCLGGHLVHMGLRIDLHNLCAAGDRDERVSQEILPAATKRKFKRVICIISSTFTYARHDLNWRMRCN